MHREKYAQIKYHLQAQNHCKQTNQWILGTGEGLLFLLNFSTGGRVIMDYGLLFWPEVMV